MTTRDELHHLVDAIDPAELEMVAAVLRPYAQSDGEPSSPHTLGALPSSLGMGHSGRGDLSERADELLAEGFGR